MMGKLIVMMVYHSNNPSLLLWFFIGLSPARSDIPIIYHKNQLGVVLVNDWFISQ